MVTFGVVTIFGLIMTSPIAVPFVGALTSLILLLLVVLVASPRAAMTSMEITSPIAVPSVVAVISLGADVASSHFVMRNMVTKITFILTR